MFIFSTCECKYIKIVFIKLFANVSHFHFPSGELDMLAS